MRRGFGARTVATWAVHLYVVMVGRTPDQMHLTDNIENGVDRHFGLAVAPPTLQGLVRWVYGWLGKSWHGHSVSPLNPLIVSIARLNSAMFSL